MQICIRRRLSTESSQHLDASCPHNFAHWMGASLAQFLDYLIVGLLLSCIMAVGWTVVFPI
jgi:hypothetical protein